MGRLSEDERLRRAVEIARARGLTQKQIAKLAGIGRDTVRECLGGVTRHPKTFEQIAEHNYSTYRNHGCRCHECSAAAREYQIEYRASLTEHERQRRRQLPPSSWQYGDDRQLHETLGDPWADPTGDAAIAAIERENT